MSDENEETYEALGSKSFSNWTTTHALVFEEDGEVNQGKTILTAGIIFSAIAVFAIAVLIASTESADINFGLLTGVALFFGVLGLFAGWLWVLEVDIADSIFPRAVLGPYLFPLGFAASAFLAIRNGVTLEKTAEELFFDSVIGGLINGVFFLLVAVLIDKYRLSRNNRENPVPQLRSFDDPFVLIERLGILKDRGLLTDDEFELKKQDILKSI
jgi:uncharacterized membrane protein YgdD (TMEM256/DUF423 family)